MKAAGVACDTRAVAMTPVALPRSRAPSSTVASGRYCSAGSGSGTHGKVPGLGPMLMILSLVRTPVAKADPAGAESATAESAMYVFTAPTRIPSSASGWPRNQRASVYCSAPQPSAMRTMTFLTGFADGDDAATVPCDRQISNKHAKITKAGHRKLASRFNMTPPYGLGTTNERNAARLRDCWPKMKTILTRQALAAHGVRRWGIRRRGDTGKGERGEMRAWCHRASRRVPEMPAASSTSRAFLLLVLARSRPGAHNFSVSHLPGSLS